MTVIFVTLGSAADYGNFGRWLLLFLTIVVSNWVPEFKVKLTRIVLGLSIWIGNRQGVQSVA